MEELSQLSLTLWLSAFLLLFLYGDDHKSSKSDLTMTKVEKTNGTAKVY